MKLNNILLLWQKVITNKKIIKILVLLPIRTQHSRVSSHDIPYYKSLFFAHAVILFPKQPIPTLSLSDNRQARKIMQGKAPKMFNKYEV